MAYSINAKFFKFAKKPNSTRRPAEQPSTMLERSVEIMEPFDLLNPTIKVVDCWTDAVKDTWTYFMQFNYVKLGDTTGNGREVDRYYWIKNWRREGGVCFADCEVDVLASWRGTIHGYEGHPNMQLVERSSAAVNTTLRDNLRPIVSTVTNKSQTMTKSTGSHWAYDTGYKMMSMFPTAATGGGISDIGLYAADNSAFITITSAYATFLQTGLEQTAFSNVSTKSIGDFCGNNYELPYPPSLDNVAIPFLRFGSNNVEVPHAEITLSALEKLYRVTGNTGKVATWTIAASSIIGGLEDWLVTDEFLHVSVKFNPFGTCTIPVSLIKNASIIYLQVIGDNFGNVICQIYGNKSNGELTETIVMGSSNVARSIGYSVMQSTSQNQLAYLEAKGNWKGGSIAAGVLNAFTNPLGAAANAIQTGIGQYFNYEDEIKSYIGGLSVNSGGASSGTIIQDNPIINITINNVAPAQNNKYGRPLHQVRNLGELVATDTQPGFVQCSDANIDSVVEDYTTYGRNGSASMTITEKTAICNFLNGGVYLE